MKDLGSDDIIIKHLFFEESEAGRFVNLFNIYLKRLNINLTDEEGNYVEDDEDNESDEINVNNLRKRSGDSNEENVKEFDNQNI